VGDKRWALFEDDPPTVPSHRSCTKVHVYAAVSKWGNANLFVAAGTTGCKSKSKGVTAKVYVKLLEEKLIPECPQLMECRPLPLRDQPWVFQQDNAPAHTA
jgi:hypothetical protein